MAKPYRSQPFLQHLTRSLRQRLARTERGQAIVIIAMAIFGLLIFIGLTVDAGILYIGVGHLRRAVDAAALAAAAQFREGRTYEEMESIAQQTVALNGVNEATLLVLTCDTLLLKIGTTDPRYVALDDVLCAEPPEPSRKLVYVEGQMPVEFAFLPLIGFESITVTAESRSEAASVDVVLILDRSESMGGDATCPNGVDDDDDLIADDGCGALDAVGAPETNFYDGLDNDGDGSPNDGYPGGGPVIGAYGDDYYTNPANCNPVRHCHPFEEVKSAAISFVKGMKFPYDRVAIVTMDVIGEVVIPITDSRAIDLNALTSTIDSLTMYQFPGYKTTTPDYFEGCSYELGQPYSPTNNPSGCVSSSTGGAIKVGAGEFGRKPLRQEAVWVIVFITDGAANASEPVDGYAGPTLVGINKWCPSTTWVLPRCRDAFWDTRHTLWDSGTNPKPNGAVYDPLLEFYDADDFARDSADFAGCAPKKKDASLWCRHSLQYDLPEPDTEGGQGALIYSIGLGKAVVAYTNGGDPDSGDRMLRYIAAVGDDGDPSTDLCAGYFPLDPDLDGVPTLTDGEDSYSCGNYYFTEFGSGLNAVFESIASRIFTRITH